MISYKKFVGYEGYLYKDGFKTSQNHNLLEENILKHVWSPCVWRDGIRLKENFLNSDFCALDFDQPHEETLSSMIRNLCDYKIIFATTKSHQKEKNGITCDRYRMIIPWSKRITSLIEYEYNMRLAYQRWEWADPQCLDAARYFFPCKQIAYSNRGGEHNQGVEAVPPGYMVSHEALKESVRSGVNGEIPSWALMFINDGHLGQSGSRHTMIFAVAFELFKQGYEEKTVRSLIRRAPIVWTDVNDVSVIKSAKSKVSKAQGITFQPKEW